MKWRHIQELHDFSKKNIVYAFNDDALRQGAIEKFGLDIDRGSNRSRIASIGAGGHMLKSMVPAYREILDRQMAELHDVIMNDPTGEGFASDAMYHELLDHEYGYTRDPTPALMELGLTLDQVMSNPRLKKALKLATSDVIVDSEDD